jgi:hypothetical protein
MNWILNPNARFMVEWTRTDFGASTLPLDVANKNISSSGAANGPAATAKGLGVTSEDVVSVRAQYNF